MVLVSHRYRKKWYLRALGMSLVKEAILGLVQGVITNLNSCTRNILLEVVTGLEKVRHFKKKVDEGKCVLQCV